MVVKAWGWVRRKMFSDLMREGKLAKSLRAWAEHPNPYSQIAMHYLLASLLVLILLVYSKRKVIKTSRKAWYEIYCLVLGFWVFFTLYLSCSWEHDCTKVGVSVSRLTGRGPVGRIWSFCMMQVTVHFVVVQTWLLGYVYKRNAFMKLVFVAFPICFLVATVLSPAHVHEPMSDVVHTFATLGMSITGFGSWLWTAWKAWNIPQLRKHAIFRVSIILLQASMFSACAYDNWNHDTITKIFPSAFLFLEIFVIFGICVIHMSIYYGEMRFVSLSMPTASLKVDPCQPTALPI